MKIDCFQLDRSQVLSDTVRIQYTNEYTNYMMRINKEGLNLLDDIEILGIDDLEISGVDCT